MKERVTDLEADNIRLRGHIKSLERQNEDLEKVIFHLFYFFCIPEYIISCLHALVLQYAFRILSSRLLNVNVEFVSVLESSERRTR